MRTITLLLLSPSDTVSPGHKPQDTHQSFSGDDVGGAIPDPIPNSEVKPYSAEDTAWVTVWENRTLPGSSYTEALQAEEAWGAFLFCTQPVCGFRSHTHISISQNPEAHSRSKSVPLFHIQGKSIHSFMEY